jgi:L-iditol 2-dehydrogenase
MKVAIWYNNQDIRIEEVPTPKPGPNEMLIKVMSCGICGSDIVEWYRLPRAPLVLGHEIGAEVVEVGEALKKFKPGDRVFIAPKVPCMKCDYCQKGHYPVCSTIQDRLPGGFAEYILVPQALIEHGTYRLPDNITYDQSTFIEPLACVVRAQRLAGLNENQTVFRFPTNSSRLAHLGQELLDMRQHEVAPCAGLEVVKAGQGDKGRVGKALSVLFDFHVRNCLIGFARVDQKGHSHTWQVVSEVGAHRTTF